MKDLGDVEFESADTLYSSPRFASVKRLILKAIGKSKGVSIRVIKGRLCLPKRGDGIIYPALQSLERNGLITNVAKKDIRGDSCGVELYVLGGKEIEKMPKVSKEKCNGNKVFAQTKRSKWADLGL